MLPLHRVSTHPGRILLKEFLEPMGTTQVKLAEAIDIPQNRVNELVRGKRGITPETALLLAEYFKNSAELWMNLQTASILPECAPRRESDLCQRPGIDQSPANGCRVRARLNLPQRQFPLHRLR
jgi:antitoxin HigA-1